MQPSPQEILLTQLEAFIRQANDLKLNGRAEEAEKIFKTLLAQFPDYAFLVYNYAALKIEQKKYSEARELARGILKKKQLADLVSIVSQTYWEENDYKKAVEVINSVPENDFSCSNILRNKIIYDFTQCQFADIISHTNKLLLKKQIDPQDLLIIHAARALSFFVLQDIENFKKSLESAAPLIEDKEAKDAPKSLIFSLRIYILYLQNIHNFKKTNPELYNNESLEEIYMIGESHCLSPAYTKLNVRGSNLRVIPRLIYGAKMFYLNDNSKHIAKISFKKTLSEIPPNSKIIICFGEIDCRVTEGIFPYFLKNREQGLEKIISDTVTPYLDFLMNELHKSGHDYFICGTPAPLGKTIAVEFFRGRIKQESIPDYLNVAKTVNALLRSKIEKGKFLDIYAITDDGQGTAKDSLYIDSVHLNPDVLNKVMEQCS